MAPPAKSSRVGVSVMFASVVGVAVGIGVGAGVVVFLLIVIIKFAGGAFCEIVRQAWSLFVPGGML